MMLNTLNFLTSDKVKLKDYLNTLNIIKKISIPKFPFDGNYLKNKGVKEGVVLGKIIKLLEVEWLDNDFKLSEEKISKIINDQRN